MSTYDYIKHFKRISEELSTASHLVDVPSMIFAFLHSLGPQYISFTVSINANINHLSF
ncbi:unnamed protein product [Spirodela intermedia]|uniref:Uncharacterized protein n=1 Tax=Spirodela intermedia TaxID=51605 RepID=A0A7I8I7C3_SPIIN|nr:unnamed protein product [Spirodela intermedia]CAA6653455.1 unnamed protein product [Spirodela intermedia]